MDAGLSHLTARITSPVIGLLSKFSRSFREISDIRSSEAFSQRRNGQSDYPVYIASFALPGISLFSLLMIAFSLLNVPISFYHLIIFLVLFAFAVYMCIKTVKKNKEEKMDNSVLLVCLSQHHPAFHSDAHRIERIHSEEIISSKRIDIDY